MAEEPNDADIRAWCLQKMRREGRMRALGHEVLRGVLTWAVIGSLSGFAFLIGLGILEWIRRS